MEMGNYAATKEIIAVIRMTPREYREFVQKSGKSASGIFPVVEQNKYHNKKVYCYEDGLVSDEKGLTSHGVIVQKYDSKPSS